MTEVTPDSMTAFEQTRVADLAAFYRALAALSDATTLDDVLALKEQLLIRLADLTPSLISQKESKALHEQVWAMTDSCLKVLGH